MPIYKRCSSCGKRLPSGEQCGCREARRQKEYDVYARDGKSVAFYHSREWTAVSEAARQYYHGIDIIELYENDKVVPGRTVHHLVPVKEDWSKRLSKDNLIYLTESNHQLIHRRMDRGEGEEVRHWLSGLMERWKDEIYGT